MLNLPRCLTLRTGGGGLFSIQMPRQRTASGALATYLRGRGKHHNAVLAAVARELAGHVWAIARMVEPKMA